MLAWHLQRQSISPAWSGRAKDATQAHREGLTTAGGQPETASGIWSRWWPQNVLPRVQMMADPSGHAMAMSRRHAPGLTETRARRGVPRICRD